MVTSALEFTSRVPVQISGLLIILAGAYVRLFISVLNVTFFLCTRDIKDPKAVSRPLIPKEASSKELILSSIE